ncbi:MAG: hypothetical protein PVJ57_04140 [Phycisphaerae bacterium]
MRRNPSRLLRVALAAALAMPLLGTGPCVQLTEDALIDGFFSALTPIVVDRLEDTLAQNEADNGVTGDGP